MLLFDSQCEFRPLVEPFYGNDTSLFLSFELSKSGSIDARDDFCAPLENGASTGKRSRNSQCLLVKLV